MIQFYGEFPRQFKSSDTGTSLDKRVDAVAQKWEKFVIKQAPYDFGSTSKAANVPINGSIPFMVGSPSENVGLYDVKWYRRTNSGAEHMTLNRVADVKVGDTLDVFCVITGLDRPGGAMQWQVAVKDYTINVVPAKLNDDRTVIIPTQKRRRQCFENRGLCLCLIFHEHSQIRTLLALLFLRLYNNS